MASSHQTMIGSICRSEKYNVQFHWTLQNFSLLTSVTEHYYESPPFSFDGCTWCLMLYTNGDEDEESYGWIDLYLKLISPMSPKTLSYTVSIETVQGSKLMTLDSLHHCFTNEDSTLGWRDVFNRSEIVRRISGLKPPDYLNISINMSTNAPSPFRGTSDTSVQTEAQDDRVRFVSDESQARKKGGDQALADIGKLLVTGDYSDLTLQVGDVQFKAHWIILAARTPLLSALLHKGKKSDTISISDCEPDIFKEYLHYVYTGNVQELTVTNVFALYRTADRYLAEGLKFQCLEYIKSTLSIETFCRVMELAVNCSETELLGLVTDFFSKNIRSIVRTLEWQKYNEEYPMLANEILIKSIRPPDAKKGSRGKSVRIDSINWNELLAGAKVSNEGRKLPEKQGGEKALADIGKLLLRGDNSDVVIQVGDVQFNVHRNILSARTPALAAMFQHQTAEKMSNRIFISDCKPDVFKEFLHYIYTGTVQQLTVQNVFCLYHVANKYLASDLVLKCLEYIKRKLCVKTFCDSVQLAVTYGEQELLQSAIDFATENIHLIIRSVEWQNFNRDNPAEANNILIKSLGPLH